MGSEGAIRLERRPEARSFTVGEILLAVRDGKIRVPEFQRPLRWKSQNVLDFFDSIYRGIPVGTLLFSRDKADAQTLHFGPVGIDAPAMSDALFVVDGQQRITSLAAAILHPDKTPRNGLFAVWFDLEMERFVRVTTTTPPLTWIPLNIAGNRKATMKWVHEWPLQHELPELVDRAFELNDRIEGFSIPVYIVERASQEALRVIFNRTNTRGMQLRENEVFDALPGRQKADSVKTTIARLADSTGFGLLNPDWFLDCYKAVEGLDPGTTFRDDMAELPSLRRAEEALRRAISFLIDDVGIPHVKMLPYKLPLLILARFFAIHADPEPRARRQLSWWVWRGALGGQHAEANHARLRELLATIGAAPYTSIERLLATTPQRQFMGDFVVQLMDFCEKCNWDGRAARSRLFALALYHFRPCDPLTGEPLSQSALQDFLNEHELGKLIIDVSGSQHGVLALHVALVTKRHVKYLADASVEVRKSHVLDDMAVDALRRRDWKEFTQYRSQELSSRMAQFFNLKVGSFDNTRPSVAAIVRHVDILAKSA
ncbi:MAG: DUF262 domain-containing protein [Polyangiaceae bacterium]|nr:DUF262 domain-containing protein [Polyangiaceae bacterium]